MQFRTSGLFWKMVEKVSPIWKWWIIHIDDSLYQTESKPHISFFTSVFRGVRLLCRAIAFHLHPSPVVNVPPGGGPPLHLLQCSHCTATAVAAWAHRDLGNSGQTRKESQWKGQQSKMFICSAALSLCRCVFSWFKHSQFVQFLVHFWVNEQLGLTW